MEHVPGKAYPRFKVVVVLLVDLIQAVSAQPHQGISGGDERHVPILSFGRRHVPFPAQAEFQRQVGPELEVVLGEEVHPIQVLPRGPVTQGNGESIGIAVDEIGDRGKAQVPGVRSEEVAVEPPELAAELECVPPLLPAQGISEHGGVVAAPLGEITDTAKAQARRGDGDLRDADAGGHPIVETQVGGDQVVVGEEGNADAIEAQARLVHHVGIKDVAFSEGKDLAPRLTRIAGSGYIPTLQRGLFA